MRFLISSCCHPKYPVDLIKGFVSYNNDMAEAFHDRHNEFDWGKPYPYIIESEKISSELPIEIFAMWKSIIDRKIFIVNEELPSKHISDKEYEIDEFVNIVMGFGPCDGFAMWYHSNKKSFIVKNSINEMSDIGMYMKQYTFRYLILFDHLNITQKMENKQKNDNVETFEYIEETLYDGTHDKLHNGGLMKYHLAGKPQKLHIKWKIEISDYSAYFWFEDESIHHMFDKFYGAHPETKTDFIIHIDAEQKKYELALFRYGLKEPVIIPEEAYQLIVFKNKFEDYRSENYNQPSGAWIW